MAGVPDAGWQSLHRLIDTGHLPVLQRLVETGCSAALVPPNLAPATVWTSIATGALPEMHGVFGPFEARPDGGGIQSASAQSWRSPPLWDLLRDVDVSSIVIGWPHSFPATSWRGIVVDERFVLPARSGAQDWPMPPDCASPASLRPALRGLRLHADELEPAERGGIKAEALAATASIHAVATYLMEHEPWQFLAVHYPLLALDGSDAAYRFLDAMISRLLQLAGAETDLLIVSPAVLLAAGPGFPADQLRHGVSLLDVAATILARFGLQQGGAPGRALNGMKCGPLRPIKSRRRYEPAAPLETPPTSSLAAGLVAQVEYGALIQRAKAAELAGNRREAAALFEQALALRPDDMEATFRLAQCRLLLGDWAGSQPLGAVLAAKMPNSPWGPMILGGSLAAKGDQEAASPYLEEALALAGSDPLALMSLAAIALYLHRWPDAAAYCKAALSADPHNADARAGLGLSQLGAGDLGGAETELRASLGLRFHAPVLHHQLGSLLAAQGRWLQAAASLRTALAQQPRLTGASRLLRRVERELAEALSNKGSV